MDTEQGKEGGDTEQGKEGGDTEQGVNDMEQAVNEDMDTKDARPHAKEVRCKH